MQYVIIPHRDDRVCLIHGGQTGRRHPLGKDELMHYRTKDSVNGVRRYQNKDGSLTPLGRIHYGIEHPREWYTLHAKSDEAKAQAQAQAQKASSDYHAMNKAGQAQADQMARRAQQEYYRRQAATQTPQVKPAPTTASVTKPAPTVQSQAPKAAAPAEKKYSFGAAPDNLQAAKPKAPISNPTPAVNQGQPLTKDQMIEKAVKDHRSQAPSSNTSVTGQRVNEIKETTKEAQPQTPSGTGSGGGGGGSLYNLDGTKKMEQPAAQPQPAPNDGKPQTTQEWIDYIKAHPGQGPGNASNGSNGIGKAVENAVNGLAKGATDLWNNTVVPTAQNVSNAVTGGLNDAGAYIQGLTGNQAEVRRQQDMQRTGMPNNAAAAVSGQQMNQNINNAAQGVGGFFDRAGQWIGNAANDVSNWVGNAANDVGKAVTGAVNGAGQWINNAANDVGNAVNGAGQWIGNAANDVGKAVTGAVNGAGQWVGNAANDVGKAVTGVVNGAGQWIGNAANDVGRIASDAWNGVAGAVNGAANEVGKTAQNVGNAVTGAVQNAGQAAGDAYRNAQNWVNNEAVPAVNRAAQNAEQFVNQTVVPGAQAAAQNTGNWLQNAWNGVTNWVGNAANDVGKAVTGAVNDTGKWIGNAANDVGKAVTDAANGVSNWAQNAYNDASNWVGNAANDVGKAVNGAGQWINNAANNVGHAVTDAANGVSNWAQNAYNDASNWVGNAANDVGQFATGVYNGFVNGDVNPVKWNYQSQNADPDSRNGFNLGSGARNIVNNAGQGISDFWNNTVVPTAQNVGNAVTGAVNGAGQGASDFWNNTVVPTAQNVGNAVGNAANGAVRGVTNAWNDITGENARRQQVAGNFAASNANENMASAQRQQMRSRLASIPGMSPNYLNSLTDSQLLSIYNNRFGQADTANYNRAQQAYQVNRNAYDYREATPQRFAQSTATEAQKSAKASQQRNSLRQQLMATGGYNPATLYNMNDSELLELYRRTFPGR